MSIHKDIKNKTKDGRMWYFKTSYVDHNDNRKIYKSKKFKTQGEAKEQEAIYMLKENNSNNIAYDLLAKDYFNNLYKKLKESTCYTYIKAYNSHIRPFFENLNIYTINTKICLNWYEKMENMGYSINYLNKIYNVSKNIIDYGMKKYSIDKNPFTIIGPFRQKNDKIIEDKNKIRYITLNEFNQFIKVIDKDLYRMFFIFIYYTGCRKGEAIALTWNDIDFQNKTISITKTLYEEVKGKVLITNTKNKKNRKIKMTNLLYESLLIYQEKVKSFTDYENSWFVFGNTKYLSTTTIDRYKHEYFKLSNITEITMHEFRHSHVSLLINEYIKKSSSNNMKVDMAKFFLMMSDRMGHSIQVMQETYMHLFPEIQDEIVDILNNL